MMQLNNKQTTGPLAEQISSAPSASQNCRTERDPACLSSSMVTSSDEALTLRSCRWCICDAISAAWHTASHQLHCWPGKIHNSQQHPFNGPLSGTTRVSRYQKGKTNLDFTEARNNEWQWHQLGHVQVCCTLLQTDNHASTPPLSFFTGRMPFLPPNQQRQSIEGRIHNSQSTQNNSQTENSNITTSALLMLPPKQQLLLHPFNGLFSKTNRVSGTRKVKPVWI